MNIKQVLNIYIQTIIIHLNEWIDSWLENISIGIYLYILLAFRFQFESCQYFIKIAFDIFSALEEVIMSVMDYIERLRCLQALYIFCSIIIYTMLSRGYLFFTFNIITSYLCFCGYCHCHIVKWLCMPDRSLWTWCSWFFWVDTAYLLETIEARLVFFSGQCSVFFCLVDVNCLL